MKLGYHKQLERFSFPFALPKAPTSDPQKPAPPKSVPQKSGR
jgi:hypothetical protein